MIRSSIKNKQSENSGFSKKIMRKTSESEINQPKFPVPNPNTLDSRANPAQTNVSKKKTKLVNYINRMTT